MPLKTLITISPPGLVIPCHSLTYNFLRLFGIQAAISTRTLVDITNANVSTTVALSSLALAGAAASITRGIILGTSLQAVDVEDYKLISPIAHGVGAGQLQYAAAVIADWIRDNNSGHLTITRAFTNGSGGTIIVREVALYAQASTYSYMIFREVIPNFSFLNGWTRTFAVTFQIAA